ncbi:hypothetical protein Tco_0129396 [Tanacetum coccineum]|uniref:Uncharacterized protein n=1 Tax=Tanacetum coccineum TaxID=301880 RepID=A0ABQ4Z248_9ASTR
MMMCKQAEQGVSNIKLRQAEWLEDTDKRMIPGSGITLQLHKAKIQEVSPAESIKYRTIHKFAPKCATYHGRSTFANPKYLKKAQSDKPRLYEIPYDTSDPANRFCPDGEDTVTLEKESRSKLDKDKVKPYNYTYQNSLYETFKPPSKALSDPVWNALKKLGRQCGEKRLLGQNQTLLKTLAFYPCLNPLVKVDYFITK